LDQTIQCIRYAERVTSPAAPPRTLTRKGEATRARILDAAAELMYDRGVGATSIDDVKRAAGVSSSQLYHYFSDQQALVTAVIARQTDLVLGFQEPHLIAVESGATLRAWRDAVVTVVDARGGAGGCPLGSLSSELSGRDDAHRAALAESFGRWEGAIRGGLERMRDRGELPDSADPEELALALLAALQGGLLLSQARRSTTPLRAALDAVIAQITASDRAGAR
jgi:TetR/AcrR family transcriptional repressor of nem operon